MIYHFFCFMDAPLELVDFIFILAILGLMYFSAFSILEAFTGGGILSFSGFNF